MSPRRYGHRDRYCPKCGEPLEPRPGYFWCAEHGVIGEAYALPAPLNAASDSREAS